MELTITIPRGILNAILEHARTESPTECCGLLSGLDQVVDLHHPLRNNSSEPDKRYFASPEDLFVAMREMRGEGRHLLAIYHSHPRGRAYPSQTDIELAFYPHVVYMIQSLDPQPEIRAYRIVDRNVTEVRIDVAESEWRQIAQTAGGASRTAMDEDFSVEKVIAKIETVQQPELDPVSEVRNEVESLPQPVTEEVSRFEIETASRPEPEAMEFTRTEPEAGFLQRVIRRVKSWF